MTPERIAAYVRELAALNVPRTVIGRLEELRDVLRVMEPGCDCSWIGRIAARCGRREADTLRKRVRLRPSSELYQLGVELMAKVEDKEFGTALERAVAFRDGLMIAILAARPLRRGSLAALGLTHVSRRGDTFWLRAPAEACKSRRPVEVPLPEALTAVIEHRPVLLPGAACDALWVGKDGKPMAASAIYARIVKLTRVAFGAAVHPHLFRDAAATTIAIEDPEHVRIGATVLGHNSLIVSERHYGQANMIHACRRYQDFLSARRRLRSQKRL